MKSLMAILPPYKLHHELDIIRTLFDAGLDELYFRRPATYTAIKQLYKNVPTCYHSGLILPVKAFDFYSDTGFKKYHVKERERVIVSNTLPELQLENCSLSTAIHQYSSLVSLPGCYDTILVSPIFNSMSKPAHKAMPKPTRLQILAESHALRTIALGGIGVDQLTESPDVVCYFDGIALMSGLWETTDIPRTYSKIQTLWKNI